MAGRPQERAHPAAHSDGSYIIADETARAIQVAKEIGFFVAEHYKELGEEPDDYDLDIDFNLYISAAARGALHIATLRNAGGALCGYHIMWIRRHPHSDRVVASDAVSYVRSTVPRRPWRLLALFRFSVECLTARGVQTFHFRVKPVADYGALLERKLGARLAEKVYKINVSPGKVRSRSPHLLHGT